jgi:hypothetical protein
MIILRKKLYSGTHILNTNAPGFIKGRKYDTDLDRLGRMETSHRELGKPDTLSNEMRKLNGELNNGRLGKWQSSD